MSLPPGAVGWFVIVAFPGHTHLFFAVFSIHLEVENSVEPDKGADLDQTDRQYTINAFF